MKARVCFNVNKIEIYILIELGSITKLGEKKNIDNFVEC